MSPTSTVNRRRVRRPTRRQLSLDAGIALLAFAAAMAIIAANGLGEPEPGSRGGQLDPAGVGLAALSSLPLVAVRLAPLAVLVAANAGFLGLVVFDYPVDLVLGPLIALFRLALVAGRPGGPRTAIALAAVVAVAAALSSAMIIHSDELPGAEVVFTLVAMAAVWVAGDRIRLRSERIEELHERAVRAERDADRERRLAAAEERARIARELHDSAGHAVNVILVQAGAARLLQERDPRGALNALRTIEEVARDTIGEIDRLVRVLRDDRDEAAPGEVEPPPGIAALATLSARHVATGMDVTTRVAGARRPLPADVDRAAFRIVQEALLNAARHGRGSADVVLAYGEQALDITVRNPVGEGGSRNGAGGGHGIVGMRERASLLGGTLEAGRRGGEFRVRAHLPYARAAA